MIEVRKLKKRFGSTEVLHGIDLQVARAEVLSIIGPSGSGKSTLLRCLNFIEEHDEGEVLIEGDAIGYRVDSLGVRRRQSEAEIARMRTRIGMVFQSFNLFPHCTVLENIVMAPMHIRRESREDARCYAMDLLKKVGLAAFANAFPSRLSGGQQQRVAIARALAMRPKAILLDEITSALDPELVGEVLTVIRQLASEGMTMVIVTHEMSFAQEIGHRLVFMDQGRIVEQGVPREMIARPKSARLVDFLQRFRESHRA